MRFKALFASLIPLAVIGAFAAGCVSGVAGRTGPQGQTQAPVPAETPDLNGRFLVKRPDDSLRQIWTITQVGNTLTGTIVDDTKGLPEGEAIQGQTLLGHIDASSEGYAALLDSPSGTMRIESALNFDFCPLKGGIQNCMIGARQLDRPSPTPRPSGPATPRVSPTPRASVAPGVAAGPTASPSAAATPSEAPTASPGL